jgi:hypothetical protein
MNDQRRVIISNAQPPLPAALVDRGKHRVLHRAGRRQAGAGFVYFENEAGRRSSAKLLTRDEAFLIAVNIAKLPSVPQQILKDIPRPPNSASWDD